MAVTTNLGRVQGGGFYGSTSTSETSIPKSTVLSGGVSPLVNDVIVNADGDLCRVTAVQSSAYTVSKFGSIKGPVGAQGPQGETGAKGDGLPSGGTAGQFVKKTADGTAWGDVSREVNIVSEDYVSWVLPLINLDSEGNSKIVSGRLVLWRSTNVFDPSFLDISAYQWYKGENGNIKDGTIVIESSMLGGINVRGVKFSYNNHWWLGLDFTVGGASLSNAQFYGIAVNAFDLGWNGIPYKNNNTGEVLNNEIITNIAQKAVVNEQSHPVNSLYMSTGSTEPASLFGGTWEKIEGVHLRAADSTYPAGTETGADEHYHKVQLCSPFYYGVWAGDGFSTNGAEDTTPIAGIYNYQSETFGKMSVWGQVTIKTNRCLQTDGDSMVETGATLKGSEGTTSYTTSFPRTLTVNVWKRVG